MDLAVGKHCSVTSCNVNDLLPIECQHCSLPFCRDHFAIDRHECSAANASTIDRNTWTKRTKCGFQSCEKPSMASAFGPINADAELRVSNAVCSRCKEAFCVIHRYPDSHECVGVLSSESPAGASKLKAAKDLLAKNFPGQRAFNKAGLSTVTPKPSTKPPSKASKTIELMKMRSKAVPGDPKDKSTVVPISQRLHVFAAGHGNKDPELLWFQKNASAGKVLDILATRFGMNDIPTKLVILQDEETETEIRLDMALGDQATDAAKVTVRPRA